MHFNFHTLWLSWLVNCFILWLHKLKLKKKLMLLKSSLIFGTLSWGLRTWIASFRLSRIGLRMLVLNVLVINIKACWIFYHMRLLWLRTTKSWFRKINYLKRIMMRFRIGLVKNKKGISITRLLSVVNVCRTFF